MSDVEVAAELVFDVTAGVPRSIKSAGLVLETRATLRAGALRDALVTFEIRAESTAQATWEVKG